ncbi:hypothetical protein [Streptomyces sp. NPDC048419]|uniref:hypothetical protein n=1 Tax=Streptomyces sp. NPDC048419 TaxID=3365547 RepID=UPI00371190EE
MTKNQPAEGAQDVVYQVRLPLSKRTISLVAGLIRQRRNQMRSPWRKAEPGKQAVIVLAVLRTTSAWPTWPAATVSGSPPSAAG